MFSLSNLRDFADNPCLITRDTVLTYAELADRIEQMTHRLPKQRGLIAVEMDASIEAIAAYLAALSAGHAVMPLPTCSTTLSSALINRFRPAAAFRTLAERRRFVSCVNPTPIHPDLALVLQTSGSTGQGKGVRLSHEAVKSNAQAIANYLEITPTDRAALILPLHYSYGLSVLHSHLAQGASLWLAQGSILDEGFATELADSGATSLAGVPHHFAMLDSAGLSDRLPDSITCMTVAGGAMPPEAVQRWATRFEQKQGRFVVMYGQTEATARIAYLPPARAAEHPNSIGQPIPGGEILLRDSSGASSPNEGELIYRGPNVMMGYAQGATDLIRGHELTELATGDLATRDKNGLLRITGRLSRMSKIAGIRIGHDALERALETAGYDAAVWGDDATIHVAAQNTPDHDSNVITTLQNLTAERAGIGRSHISVTTCDALPRHASGKINYPKLKQQTQSRSAHNTPNDPPAILSSFAQIFAPQPVSHSDSFKSLGGDSLRHVELTLTLEKQLKGLPVGWEHMSIAQLAQAKPARPSLPMPILARALAIIAVVVAHQTSLPVYGGAAAMVILLGMSVAEHRTSALVQGQIWPFLQPTLRVLWPYFAIVAGYALAWQQVPWASVFLIGNFGVTSPETHLMLPYLYWFVEAYMQMTVLILLLFTLPFARSALAKNPFVVGLALLALAIVMRVVIPEIWPIRSGRSQFSVPWVFYLFALGWCITTAQTLTQRLVVIAAASVIMPMAAYLGGNWYGGWVKYMSLLALCGLLLSVSHIQLPHISTSRWLTRTITLVAQGAFPIYLLHRFVPESIMPNILAQIDVTLSPLQTDIVAIFGGILLGLLAAHALRMLSHITFRPNLSGQALNPRQVQ